MDRIEEAFQVINRADFLSPNLMPEAELDVPISIGHNQTISQPSTVKLMLNWLEPRIGDKIMDVGSESGWSTALLSYIVGDEGHIFAVERIPELLELSRANCTKADISNAEFFLANPKYLGLPELAPFDRILVSASAPELPRQLLEQLKTGGKIVIPVNTDILEIKKISPNEYQTTVHQGFIFVPLI